jgi:hypothetical protein
LSCACYQTSSPALLPILTRPRPGADAGRGLLKGGPSPRGPRTRRAWYFKCQRTLRAPVHAYARACAEGGQRLCYAHQDLPRRMDLSSPRRKGPDGEEARESFKAEGNRAFPSYERRSLFNGSGWTGEFLFPREEGGVPHGEWKAGLMHINKGVGNVVFPWGTRRFRRGMRR